MRESNPGLLAVVMNWSLNILVHVFIAMLFGVLWNTVLPGTFGLPSLSMLQALSLWTLWMGGLFVPFLLFYAVWSGNRNERAAEVAAEPRKTVRNPKASSLDTVLSFTIAGQTFETTLEQLVMLIQSELDRAAAEKSITDRPDALTTRKNSENNENHVWKTTVTTTVPGPADDGAKTDGSTPEAGGDASGDEK